MCTYLLPSYRSKRPKVTAPPSGLIPHWRDKAPEAKTLRKDAPENTGEALGGLTDTHAEADPPSESDQLEVAPTFLPKAKMKSRQQSSNVSDTMYVLAIEFRF